MKINNNYIGVFDSGIGGLTVLTDLKNKFPNEKFLYFGDTARCPYGIKTRNELMAIVESDVDYFIKNKAKMIVIACNTATANSYHIESETPIIRIIEPTAKKALKVREEIKSSKPIGVFATNYTINSKAYNKFLGDENTIGVCCSPWVDIIEKGLTDTLISRKAVSDALCDIKGKVDVIILGCTHFGLIEKEIKEYLGNVTIINSSLSLEDIVKDTLDEVGYCNEGQDTIINISGNVEDINIKPFEDTLKLKKEMINHIDL